MSETGTLTASTLNKGKTEAHKDQVIFFFQPHIADKKWSRDLSPGGLDFSKEAKAVKKRNCRHEKVS